MFSVLFWFIFLACGVVILFSFFPKTDTVTGIWLGFALGTVCQMWLPVLFAFFFRFSITAHVLALLSCVVFTAVVGKKRFHGIRCSGEKIDRHFFIALCLCCIPFTILSGYIQYTHTLMPGKTGALMCGQSTYGDLCMHLSFITSLREMAFPPSYNLLYGTTLSYPFLTDSLSTTFYLLGMPLNMSVVVPGTFLMFLTYAGFMILAREIIGNRPLAVSAAFFLFFLNGGFGFLYDFDLSFETKFEKIKTIFSGYYKAPANRVERNMRFSNVICDLMIPQRALMGGWALGIPSLYLLIHSFRKKENKEVILLAVMAGALPLIHTHTFLALGLFSGGFIIGCLITDKDRKWIIRKAAIYLCIVLALALPQLIKNAFQQTIDGGFMRFQFNWVNNSGGRGFRDDYLWFWIKNAGAAFLLFLFAFPDILREKKWDILLGMTGIFIVAETVLFQPNEYDNNKLFYIWYIFVVILAADYGGKIMERLRGLKGRVIICAFFMIVSTVSGVLSIGREAVSSYQLFSPTAVEAGKWIEKNTDKEAVFMTGTQHINPVCTLAGRKIVCGSDLYVFFHGLSYAEQKNDCVLFYAFPQENVQILDKYDISYIYVSDYERAELQVDLQTFDAMFENVFENADVKIYKVNHERSDQ